MKYLLTLLALCLAVQTAFAQAPPPHFQTLIDGPEWVITWQDSLGNQIVDHQPTGDRAWIYRPGANAPRLFLARLHTGSNIDYWMHMNSTGETFIVPAPLIAVPDSVWSNWGVRWQPRIEDAIQPILHALPRTFPQVP